MISGLRIQIPLLQKIATVPARYPFQYLIMWGSKGRNLEYCKGSHLRDVGVFYKLLYRCDCSSGGRSGHGAEISIGAEVPGSGNEFRKFPDQVGTLRRRYPPSNPKIRSGAQAAMEAGNWLALPIASNNPAATK